MNDETFAMRIHGAYYAYNKLAWELMDKIADIVGEDRLEDAHVEQDSQYDNSVEVCLINDEKLTDEERRKILALGFSRVWNDKRSKRQ